MDEMKEAVGNWREAKQFSPADENDFLRWLDKADTEEKLFSRLTFWFTFRGLPADQNQRYHLVQERARELRLWNGLELKLRRWQDRVADEYEQIGKEAFAARIGEDYADYINSLTDPEAAPQQAAPEPETAKPAGVQAWSARELSEMELPPIRHVVEGLLPMGMGVLVAKPKLGKSWMVLWLCLQISRGEAVWGLPTRKTDVVYLALEDREWRVQQRMQELTDSPPENLRFGFSCGQLGAELEGQIEETLREFPSTGLIFIDTLQMVRDNASAKVNAYAQDYKDLSGLKKLADDHGICIFVVHHTRKERDSSNIFNDMTGSTGILGVADTGMILRKDDRFGDCATLCITGRDVEEKKLKMQMRGVRWEITEALSADDLRKERIPDFVFQVADFLLAHGRFRGTVSQLLAAVGNTELKPNLASKHLTRHYSDVLLPLGITYEYRKTAAARLVLLELHDGADGHDGSSGSERLASLRKQNDGTFRLPQASSQASSASWEEAEDDEELPL